MLNKKISTVVFYEALGVTLASLTGVLGAVPLMFLRREIGRWWFLGVNLALVAAFSLTHNIVLWLPYLVCTLLVAFYFETEHWGYFKSGFFSVAKTALLIGICSFVYFRMADVSPLAWAVESMQALGKSVQSLNSELKIEDIETIAKQLPSIIVTLLGVTMWLAILFDRKLRGVSQLFQPHEDPLLNLRLPDILIWITIAALLFSFTPVPITGVQETALNILNVILLLYFFQGLSIVAFAFAQFRLGPFLKAILYVVLVTQLFLFISILGILDYWLNFRKKIFKKPSEEDSV